MAIDFYNNYITNLHDNPIETDGSMHNIRVMRNMMINSASHAFCNQPALGGPVYWIRNIAYHLPGGSTRLTGGSAGVLFYNNTILTETAGQVRERALAQQPDPRRELAARRSSASTPTPTTARRTTTASGRIPARRVVPVELAAVRQSAIDLVRAGQRSRAARNARVPDARRLQRGDRTGSQQRAGRLRRLRERAAARRAGSRDGAEALSRPKDFDFRLKPGSAAVDRGVALPNVTDGFAGRRPISARSRWGRRPALRATPVGRAPLL